MGYGRSGNGSDGSGRGAAQRGAVPGPGKRTLAESAQGMAAAPSPKGLRSVEQFLRQVLDRSTGAAAGGAGAATGAGPASRDGKADPATKISNNSIGAAALPQVDAVRDKPLPPELPPAPASISATGDGDRPAQEGGPRTYEEWLAAAAAAHMTLEDYLVQTLGLDVDLLKAITMVGFAETRSSGIDAVTAVNQTVINRYQSGGASVTGNQYGAVAQLLEKVPGFNADADLRDEDHLLISQLSASFDGTVATADDLTLISARDVGGTELSPEALLLQWLAGTGYSPTAATTQATPIPGYNNRFDVSVSAGEASASAVARPYEVAGYRNSNDFDNWSINIEGGEALIAQEAYRRTVRLLAGIQLGQATLFFPEDVYGEQLVASIERADANGNLFERHMLNQDLLVAIDDDRAAAVPEVYRIPIAARGPLVSGVSMTKYEWLIIQHTGLTEAEKVQILSSMVLQPGAGDTPPILSWSGPWFETNSALLGE